MSVKKQQGFTLVELVIVLAIAAIIIAGVLIAVGGAQRSQRDTSRKNIASQVSSALESYASNNGGSYPSADAGLATYVSTLKDPDTSASPKFWTADLTSSNYGTKGIEWKNSSICNGGNLTATGATSRNYAVTYWSENAQAPQCLDNK